MFILCALVPIIALTILSFVTVKGQLQEQGEERLRYTSKRIGMSLLGELIGAAHDFDEGFSGNGWGETIVGAGLWRNPKGFESLFGPLPPVEWLNGLVVHPTPEHQIQVVPRQGAHPRLFLLKEVAGEKIVRIGEVDTSVIFDRLRAFLPENSVLVVFDQRKEPLLSSTDKASSLAVRIVEPHTMRQVLEWDTEASNYFACAWPLFLGRNFHSESWTVVLAEPKAGVLRSARNFTLLLGLIILLSLGTVCLASSIQIRRNLGPVEELKVGTLAVAGGDFSSRVRVQSEDELGDLARSFNAMANQLGRQFQLLEAAARIDRAVLSAKNEYQIAEAVLAGLSEVVGSEVVAVTILDPDQNREARHYLRLPEAEQPQNPLTAALSEKEYRFLESLQGNPAVLTPGIVPLPLSGRLAGGDWTFVVAPVLFHDQLAGAVTLGTAIEGSWGAGTLKELRQFADQFAVGLSNIRLISTLQRLNWETLEALALAIDAKSPWTAGHSERVTHVAIGMARILGLPEAEQDTLRRACLLHDIGKIGVPPEILDKPAKLTDEEFRIMREHCTIGARILEPLSGFKAALPVTLYHHERFDGTGYPEGLAGENIPLHARIAALADVYDALVSDRPYRPAWEHGKVVSYIRENAGKQFDPRVVAAFENLMKEERTREDLRRDSVLSPGRG